MKFFTGIAFRFICIASFCTNVTNAQFKQDTSKSIKYLLLPVVYRTIETDWAFGLSGSISFKTSYKNDTLIRTSNIQAFGIFTTENQNIQVIDATIFFPKEKYILYTQISHSYFPDKFWGIGPNTKEGEVDPYVFEQVYFSPHLKRKIAKKFFAGVLYEYQDVFKVDYSKGGTFDTSAFYGKKKYLVSGLGFSLSYDSRNNSFWPTKGIFYESTFTKFDDLIGSDFNLIKWTIDVRYFQKLFKDNILAMQFYNYLTNGQSPIRELAALGGANNLRGIYQGRFKDNNMMSFIAEIRSPIVWRLSICTFGGVGNVYNKWSDLQNSELKYSFGGGLRVALLEKEKLNLRLDYGYYKCHDNGFYITVGECF
jgi:outer membrane protein assembly factor BamA